MPTNFRLKYADANSLNFADPAKVARTLRVVQNVASKTVKGVRALNNRLEFISSNTAPLSEGDKTVDELIASRVFLSGSTTNKAVILAEWTMLKAAVDAAIADGALDGFLPRNAAFVATP